MHVVVTYDIVNDLKRTRLAKALKIFLVRVQKSVFEGDISSNDFPKMVKAINKEIDHKEDNVRIYHLCVRCKDLTDIIGIGTYTPGPEEDEVY